MKLFMYGLLLRPELRAYLGVEGKDWRHGVPARNYILTEDWGGHHMPISRMVPHYRGVVYGSVAEFTEDELRRIDRFEGVPVMYERVQIETDIGHCWAYRGRVDGNPLVEEAEEMRNAEAVCD